MTDLAKVDNQVIQVNMEELSAKIIDFQKKMHEAPPIEEVKVNAAAGNTKYVPISFLQMNLDEDFKGLWCTKNFQSKTIANEEVGSIELWYFHPVAQIWLCRIGVGSVMIGQKSGSEITDLNAKIKNTMSKDYPHLEAECFRNACLSLGQKYGRDLNRKHKDQYNPFDDEIEETDLNQEAVLELEARLSEFSKYKELFDKGKTIRDEFTAKGLPKEFVRAEILRKLEAIK